jgi:WD40 repeat protein
VTDLHTLKTVATLEHHDLIIPSAGCNFGLSHNGKFLAVGSQNGQVFVFNLETNKIEEIFTGEHTTSVVGCDWDPCWGSRLATID